MLTPHSDGDTGVGKREYDEWDDVLQNEKCQGVVISKQQIKITVTVTLRNDKLLNPFGKMYEK